MPRLSAYPSRLSMWAFKPLIKRRLVDQNKLGLETCTDDRKEKGQRYRWPVWVKPAFDFCLVLWSVAKGTLGGFGKHEVTSSDRTKTPVRCNEWGS